VEISAEKSNSAATARVTCAQTKAHIFTYYNWQWIVTKIAGLSIYKLCKKDV